ncbi:MAG: PIG-L family deacetylase, partial [Anaerolineales bacterium]|nr:PIG-L family deacetylase [Anaerolineales bacterium]
NCACAALGIAPPILLDYYDGALIQVDEREAVAQVLKVIRALQPQVVLTWPLDGLSGHPDHIAVSRWTTQALEESNLLAALYYLAVPRSVARSLGLANLHALPDEEITLAVDATAVWEQKITAIRCHRTQIGESPILSAPEEKQRLFLGQEHFIQARAHPERDVFLEML